jgi:DeoR/GlpR family transcriptional regulator of sugar metabolism
MSAEQFVSNAIRLFPPDTSEWARKITTRINEKEKIANIGVDIIRAEIVRSGNEGLNIIIDSGTTCLFLIKSFLRKIEENRIMHLTTEMKKEEDYSTALYGSATNKCKEIFFDISNITIITNSAPAVAAISEDIRALNQGLQLFSTGGLLKLSTQALILEKKMSYKHLEQFLEGQAKKRRTISFVGATAFDRNNLKTKTLDEVTAKQQFISHSNTAYILVDHSKPRNVTEDDYTFSPIDTSRMIFITDQKKEMEGFQEFTVIDSGHDVRQLFGKVREE